MYTNQTCCHYCFFIQCIKELQQSQWLFPYEKLEFEKEVGSGAFGVVWRAVAKSVKDGGTSVTVAVKTLKGQNIMLKLRAHAPFKSSPGSLT